MYQDEARTAFRCFLLVVPYSYFDYMFEIITTTITIIMMIIILIIILYCRFNDQTCSGLAWHKETNIKRIIDLVLQFIPCEAVMSNWLPITAGWVFPIQNNFWALWRWLLTISNHFFFFMNFTPEGAQLYDFRSAKELTNWDRP